MTTSDQQGRQLEIPTLRFPIICTLIPRLQWIRVSLKIRAPQRNCPISVLMTVAASDIGDEYCLPVAEGMMATGAIYFERQIM